VELAESKLLDLRTKKMPISGWSLEVVNSAGTSTVWQDEFPSDAAANEEFLRTVTEEGMTAFLDSAKVVPFRR